MGFLSHLGVLSVFLLILCENVFSRHTPNTPTDSEVASMVMCPDVFELQDGELQIGFRQTTWMPMNVYLGDIYPNLAPEHQFSGFDAALMKMMCNTLYIPGNRNPIRPVFIPLVTTDFQADLLGPLSFPQYCDVSISFITSTYDREQQFNVRFVNYTGDEPTQVVYPSSENPNDWDTYEDLCGRSFAVMAGTIYESLLMNLLNNICDDAGLPNVTPIPYPLQVDANQGLLDGEADAMLSSIGAVNSFLLEHGDEYTDTPMGCQFAPPFLQAQHLGIAINAESEELIDCVERAITRMDESGQLEKLFEFWTLRFSRFEENLVCKEFGFGDTGTSSGTVGSKIGADVLRGNE